MSQENHFSKGPDVKPFCIQLFFGQSNITSAYHLPMSCLITANILYKVHVTEDIQIALDCLFRNGKQRGKVWDIYRDIYQDIYRDIYLVIYRATFYYIIDFTLSISQFGNICHIIYRLVYRVILNIQR